MKTSMIFSGLVAAITVILLSFSTYKNKDDTRLRTPSPAYKWTMAAPPGSGTHQHEWKPGTYPSAVIPVKGPQDKLWMIGQRKSWSSEDGIRWNDHDKSDWGERISTRCIYFKDRLWLSGGMEYTTNTFLNEIWSSKDGVTWQRTVKNAAWSPRKNHALVAFKDRLWIFGGETAVDANKEPTEFINDVWSSSDGINWSKVLDEAPWEVRGTPQVTVFKNKLWLIGGQGHSDIWNSEDGKLWTKISDHSPWQNRYDYGLAVYDNFIFVFGGRGSNPRNAYNDAWFSPNGTDWIQQTDEASWTRRSGNFNITFADKLFLYGGKHTGHNDSFSGDIWTLTRVDNRRVGR